MKLEVVSKPSRPKNAPFTTRLVIVELASFGKPVIHCACESMGFRGYCRHSALANEYLLQGSVPETKGSVREVGEDDCPF
jgi:hypothetical protein